LEANTVRGAGARAWDGLDALRANLRRSLQRFDVCSSDIDDVVQEAFLRAARYRHRLTDDARLPQWVTRIAVNVMHDRLRRGTRLPLVETSEDRFALIESREGIPGDGPGDEWLESDGEVYERGLMLRHLGRALAELSPADRRALARWYARPDGESAASLVCERSPQLAKVHVFRARCRLVRLLRKRLALIARAGALDELPRLSGTAKERRGARRAAVQRKTKEERGAEIAARSET
jgi:RNA polymerase sigma factor (sigma-70 family)